MAQTRPEVQFHSKVYFPNTSPCVEKVMYIVRGLPGSGKSTFCRNMVHKITGMPLETSRQNGNVVLNNRNIHALNSYIMSTDSFFTTIGQDGAINYNFDPKLLKKYHELNKQRTQFQLQLGVTPLFIDNTNIKLEEITPYIEMATQAKYKVVVVEPWYFYPEDTSYNATKVFNVKWLTERCTKKIPLKTLVKMLEAYDTRLGQKYQKGENVQWNVDSWEAVKDDSTF